MTVCGYVDDTLKNRERLDKPGCLQMFWYGEPQWVGCQFENGEAIEDTCVRQHPLVRQRFCASPINK
ncbi:hypothetical protein BU26DRAFT_95410 [Trematosphaeria pertusa]|uniref:Uncharacterized protein n=1 Tax=Trematosphaeria pertusa TaxID=390896 RepID=A0A6A6I140_9PLEO|nr:uncharacterized protein BU26DRAFT_95410 [Trematosphaeria pertusa]KAF2244165.1 hypothetical protein BU26DRAFT_95410 [Trematosphaeria pertusa]